MSTRRTDFINGFHDLAREAAACDSPILAQALCMLGAACAMGMDQEAMEALRPVSEVAVKSAYAMEAAGIGTRERVM